MSLITDDDEVHDPCTTTEQGRMSSERLYTLGEIEALAKKWAVENEATTDARWIVRGLLTWLKRREKEDGR